MKSSSLLTDKKGFTIIEVVLVLAIASLIFLVVFLALPQLQRNQRNSDRRQTAGRIVAAVNEYTSNNNGSFPADVDELSTDGYVDMGNYDNGDGSQLDNFELVKGEDCDGASAARSFNIITQLETGNGQTPYCVDG